MAYQLNIRFAGMCLLVHDPEEDKLQVLLPPMGHSHAAAPLSSGPHRHPTPGFPGHSHAPMAGTGHGQLGAGPEGMEVHLARLLYDTGYEVGPADQRVATGIPRLIELENRAVDLTGLPTSSRLMPNMGEKDVVELDRTFGLKIDPALFRSKTGGRVLSRITLPAGSITDHEKGARWRLPGSDPQLGSNPRHMAVWIEWSIRDVRQDSLQLVITGMNGAAYRTELTLYPIDGVINLYVYNTPATEIPTQLPPPRRLPEAAPPTRAEHFLGYYPLFNLSPQRLASSAGVIPEFVDMGEESPIPAMSGGGAGTMCQQAPGMAAGPAVAASAGTLGGSRVACILGSTSVDTGY